MAHDRAILVHAKPWLPIFLIRQNHPIDRLKFRKSAPRVIARSN